MAHTVTSKPIKCPVCKKDALWIGDEFESATTVFEHALEACRISNEELRQLEKSAQT